MTLLYDVGVHLIALGSLLRKKSRSHFRQRLGDDFPSISKGKHPLIWVHAVSLGETKAVAPLIHQIKKEHPQTQILLSTVTGTGHAEGKRSIPEASCHLYLPFDLSYRIVPLVKKIQPDLVILSETDFWIHFQRAAKESGAQIVLVNGKLSERSYNRLLWFPRLTKALLHTIDCFCVQGETYAKRFQNLGIPREKIHITGNLKLEGVEQALPLELGIQPHELVLTLGSTHAPEEKLCLRALRPLLDKMPHLKVLIAPRHPERFDEVETLLKREKYPYSRYSALKKESRILLLDRMGLLKSCYAQSHLAFVGGTFLPKVGGHNILEPAVYGVPVLFGPHMHAQPDLLDLCRSYEAGIQVNQKNLPKVLSELLATPEYRKKLGRNGQQLIAASKGALEKTYHQLFS